jgi:hypothetical protein
VARYNVNGNAMKNVRKVICGGNHSMVLRFRPVHSALRVDTVLPVRYPVDICDPAPQLRVIDDHPSASNNISAHGGLHREIDAFFHQVPGNWAFEVEPATD